MRRMCSIEAIMIVAFASKDENAVSAINDIK